MNGRDDANPFLTRGENARKVLQRDPNPHLFRPIRFRTVDVRNRIVVSPMCQYSATDGVPNDWHFQHLASRAVGGAGIVFTEATHVEPRGRITPHCLGLWNDEQTRQFRRIAAFVRAQGAVPGIQLAHAGRKGSTARPPDGGAPIVPEKGGWTVIAPSPIPYAPGHPVPVEMDLAAIGQVTAQFAGAARRAHTAGFQVLEIHAAHGYLIHEFLSPLSNHRTDHYGGSFENRIRLLHEILAATRREWPDDLPLFVRISATDWIEGGWDLRDSVALGKMLRADGRVDLVDCSSAGLSPEQRLNIYPGYQVPFAAAVRGEAGIPTSAVGLINGADMAEQIIARKDADLVVLGRAMLANPHWPMQAAKTLRAKIPWPWQYERGDIY